MPNYRRKSGVKKSTRRRKIIPPRRGTVKRNPNRGLVMTGVRSLVTAIPGSAILSPMVDLFFANVGLTQLDMGSKRDGFISDGVAIYGATGAAFINYVNIAARSPNASLDLTKGPRAFINTPNSDARLLNLTISALPDNSRGTRSGRWTMLFIPFRSEGDYTEISQDYRPIEQSRLQVMAGSVTDSADRPLNITFKPKTSDGLISRFNPINNFFGVIIVAYSNLIRDEYHEFKSKEFATSITLRGSIEVRQPYFTSAVRGFEDKTWSPDIGATVYSSSSNKSITLQRRSFVCISSNIYPERCIMRGLEYVPFPPAQVTLQDTEEDIALS